MEGTECENQQRKRDQLSTADFRFSLGFDDWGRWRRKQLLSLEERVPQLRWPPTSTGPATYAGSPFPANEGSKTC